MKKKLVSLLLVVVMLLSLVACNKTPADTTAADSNKDTAAAAGDTAAAVNEEDLTVVKILCKTSSTSAYTNRQYEKHPDWADVPAFQEFAARLAEVGVKLEFEAIDDEQYNEAVATRLRAGVDLPDIIVNPGIGNSEAVSLGESGLVADFAALCEEYDEDGSIMNYINSKVGSVLPTITTENGNIYWAPYTYTTTFLKEDGTVNELQQGVPNTLSIRKDWIEAIGEEYKMFYTPDEFADLIIKMYEQDANGNGVSDEVIGTLSDSFYTGFESAFGLARGLIGIRTDGEGVVCNIYSENFDDYIRFLQKLYNGGVIDTTTLTGTNVITANRASTIYDYCTEYWHEASIVGYEDTATYAPIILDDDEGENGYAVPGRDSKTAVYDKWFINAQSDNLEAVMKLMDVVYTDETALACTWGREGYNFEYNADGTISQLTLTEDQKYHDVNYATLDVIAANAIPKVVDETTTEEAFKESQKKSVTTPRFTDKDAMVAFSMETIDKQIYQEGTQPLAMATASEIETMEALETTIYTYVSELVLQLIVGEKSLDDMDTYIAELEDIGLKDYVAVYEARHARYLNYLNENGIQTPYN